MKLHKLARDISLLCAGGAFFIQVIRFANEENNSQFNNIFSFSLSAFALVTYSSQCYIDKYGLFKTKENQEKYENNNHTLRHEV